MSHQMDIKGYEKLDYCNKNILKEKRNKEMFQTFLTIIILIRFLSHQNDLLALISVFNNNEKLTSSSCVALRGSRARYIIKGSRPFIYFRMTDGYQQIMKCNKSILLQTQFIMYGRQYVKRNFNLVFISGLA